MSKYTTELRYVCENLYPLNESKGYDSVQDIIDETWDKVFDFMFPIFNEEYREILCKKIIKHYYTRELCEETYGLWKLRLDSRMNEIMPYFNKLYESELISVAPLINYRINETDSATKGGTDTINTSGSGSETTSGSNTNIRTGGYTDTESENSSKVRTGSVTDNNVKSGNETLGKTGKESETKKGEITKTKEGKISDTHTGQGETTERYEGDGGKVTTTDWDLFTDTPQGNVLNMGTGQYSGIDNDRNVPIVGDDTAYLTTAEKTINEREDKSKWNKYRGFGKDEDDNDYKETTTRQYGEEGQGGTYEPYTEKENYGQNGVTVDREFTNRTDTKTYNNVTDNRTTTYNNLTDTVNKGGSNQRVYNSLTDTSTNTGSKTSTDTGLKSILYGMTNSGTKAIIGSKGKSDSQLLEEFRKTFLNIDEMIIAKLSDLFMLLW